MLAMQIRNIMGDMLHRAYASYLTPDDFKIGDWSETLIVDSTDAPMDVRRILWDEAKKQGIRIIRASYEGRTELAGGIAVVSSSLPFQKSGDNGGNYNSPPDQSLSFMAAGLAGSMVLEMIKSGKIQDKQVEIPILLGGSFDPPPAFVETEVFHCEDPDCPNETNVRGTYCEECTAEGSEEPF